ncbi:MAG: folylpolyglutamate synthase/dihydrofolate synthase family protein, partial [Planctomycetota bacterium]
MDSQGSGDTASASQRLHAVLERLGALTDWERRGRRAGMRVNTAPIEALTRALGHPERGGRSIHVAGSKGKGSTCAWLAAALQAGGWCTGRYGSPHLESVTERVVIDGVQDGEGPLAAALESVLVEVERGANEATWFDVLTAAAWLRFEQERCDWRVIEVGLGGRLDSTNALSPELCLITS